MNYKEVAAKILKAVGGDENVQHLGHCSTRFEPIITLSYYEMPLHLSLKYNGWIDRKLIDYFNF